MRAPPLVSSYQGPVCAYRTRYTHGNAQPGASFLMNSLSPFHFLSSPLPHFLLLSLLISQNTSPPLSPSLPFEKVGQRRCRCCREERLYPPPAHKFIIGPAVMNPHT